MRNSLIVIILFLTQLSADVNKEGLFGGIGIGLSSSKGDEETSRSSGFAIPFRFGYGVNKDLLIYISGEGVGRKDKLKNNITEVLAGLGVSYYINDLTYIKATIAGSSVMEIENSGVVAKLSGTGYSFGYGHMLSAKSAIELTYADLSFDKLTFLGRTAKADGGSNIISITYQYFWF